MLQTPTVISLLFWKKHKYDTELNEFIKHSVEGIKSQLTQSDFRISLANKCKIINKMVFFNIDLEYLNCKTLWSRSEKDTCDKINISNKTLI